MTPTEYVTEVAPPEEPGATLDRPRRSPLERIGSGVDASSALLPAALVLFFSFQAGGFFPGSTGIAAAVLAVLLALRATLATHPFASLNAPVVLVAAALAFYGTWIIVSASWSSAPWRALVEFDRMLLYGLAFVTCATLAWSPRRVAWAVRALVLAIFVVCLVGWASRVAPDVVSLPRGQAPDRLSQPLTYWNAQGLIAALGVVFAVHLASSAREPRAARALGAAAVPLLASTLFFTFSRGAILAGVIGILTYVVLYRSRGLVIGALSVPAPAALALLYSYDADRLASAEPFDAAAIAQGHTVAVGVGIATLAALVISLAATQWLHRPVHRAALPPRARRPVAVGVALMALAIAITVPLALGAPDYVSRQYDRFLTGDQTIATDQRARLLDAGNNGRLGHWSVALDEFRANPVRGTGAGTYEHSWNRLREKEFNVRDAHSLYLETLSELGLVGAALLALALGTIAGAALWRGQIGWRRSNPSLDPSLYAGFCAALTAWAVHAGLDWMWETPAVTVWLFALGGMLLASRVGSDVPAGPRQAQRVAIGLGCLVLAVVPVQVIRSQAALDDGLRAFQASPRDCPGAIDASLRSLAAVGARSEPWEIIAYCDVGQGELTLAVQAARNAVRRDPDNWTFRYALALVQGAAGQDPRPAARQALARNPRSGLARKAVKDFGSASKRRWPRIARRLELPVN